MVFVMHTIYVKLCHRLESREATYCVEYIIYSTSVGWWHPLPLIKVGPCIIATTLIFGFYKSRNWAMLQSCRFLIKLTKNLISWTNLISFNLGICCNALSYLLFVINNNILNMINLLNTICCFATSYCISQI